MQLMVETYCCAVEDHIIAAHVSMEKVLFQVLDQSSLEEWKGRRHYHCSRAQSRQPYPR